MSQNFKFDTQGAIVLRNTSIEGYPLEATFLPQKGMNMISFKKGDAEAIDLSTQDPFLERYAGLGALIGPHFHRRRPELIPLIKDEALFPHIATIKKKGIVDPFSHGIGRYAPWQATCTPTKVNGTLTGKDIWNGVPLMDLEGQNFKMTFQAELLPNGLYIDLSVVSDTDSLVGLHYYCHLPTGKGKVISSVQKQFIEEGQLKPIPSEWNLNDQNALIFDLEKPADYTFFPYPDYCKGVILLDAETYKLQTIYSCVSQENSWQLYHPQGASFCCIEPLSSQDPHHPNLTASSIFVHLEILGNV
jgi:hypothetical protein